MTAWCHGAAGIALSRMELLHASPTPDPYLKQEITSAIQTTLRTGFGHNHSLCHGDLGNLEVLLFAIQQCGMHQYTAELESLTEQILTRGEQQGWLSGIPLGVETPGLMLGLAGIGYQLLRLARPDMCPCLLLVAPPLLHKQSVDVISSRSNRNTFMGKGGVGCH
jgi:lantibiotic modifying enzyme